MAKEEEYLTLCGTVEHVTYTNADTGFTVLDLSADGELVCVVGLLADVQEGEELKLTGRYQAHPTFGMQFKAEVAERRLPATENAICKYLASGVVKGIGPALASRIVERFGTDTLKIMEETPERLAEVSGISKNKAAKMAEEFRQVFGVRSLMLFLQQHGLTPMQSVAVFKRWGAAAQNMIKANPYVLSTSDLGIPFPSADAIARQLDMPPDHTERLYAGMAYVLTYNANNGHTALPRKFLLPTAQKLLGVEEERLSDALEEELAYGRLFSYTDNTELIYLPLYFTAQQYIASRLQLMLLSSRHKMEHVEETIDLIETEKGIAYEALQRRAIQQAVENDVFILTGGPGTGKTTTLNGMIEALEQQGRRVALAAPTGRAAKRLAEVTGREAKTIHRLLEVGAGYARTGRIEFVHNEQDPLDADAVIVDEMSMVDTLLFESLLRGLKPTAKLIMVGDFHQLPSVGAGNILHDLIESDTIPTVELTRIFRQAAQSLIVTNAHDIVQGIMPDLSRRDNDFFFMPQTDPQDAAELVCDLCCRRLPQSYGFSPIEDIQVLCPSRKGALGVAELNARLQQRLNPPAAGKVEFKNGPAVFRTGDKVMQIRNNYDIAWTREDGEKGAGIFNGDIGVIQMVDRGSRTMLIDFDGRQAYYSFDMANELELAYAVTVHKSQGSEFDAIILPVMGGFDKLYYRNLLYTAVTRAKQILVLVGQKSRVAFMVQNDKKMLRYTGLKRMLREKVLHDA